MPAEWLEHCKDCKDMHRSLSAAGEFVPVA
jgi:hypothetical protein